MHEPSGLRFDVYERVHLPQEAADIREIEELELTPYVQAVRQGEQVLLRGSLLLGGVYLPDDESRNSRRLEHWIPVEITLPLDRVNRIEELAVEVDNFDVDLLDKRTINITGVLMLKGVGGKQDIQPQAYAWGEEPYTVVHRRTRERDDGTEEREERGADEAEAAVRQPESAAEAEGPATADLPDTTDQTAEPAVTDGSQTAEEQAERSGEDRLLSAEEPAEQERADVLPSTEQPAARATVNRNVSIPFETAAPGEEAPAAAAEPGERRSPQQEAARPSGPVEWTEFSAQLQTEAGAETTGSGLDDGREAAEADGFRREPAGASSPSPEAGTAARAQEPTAEQANKSEDESANESAAVSTAESAEPAVAPASAQIPLQAEPSEPIAEGEPLGPASLQQSADNVQASPVKVAVGAKREDGQQDAGAAAGFSKLFFPERREIRREEEPEAPADAAYEQDDPEREFRSPPAEEVEWRSLFRGAAGQEAFRTVRLCIVQKDDTLDAIAERYQLNAREIALVNRISGGTVTEGQVLLIP